MASQLFSIFSPADSKSEDEDVSFDEEEDDGSYSTYDDDDDDVDSRRLRRRKSLHQIRNRRAAGMSRHGRIGNDDDEEESESTYTSGTYSPDTAEEETDEEDEDEDEDEDPQEVNLLRKVMKDVGISQKEGVRSVDDDDDDDLEEEEDDDEEDEEEDDDEDDDRKRQGVSNTLVPRGTKNKSALKLLVGDVFPAITCNMMGRPRHPALTQGVTQQGMDVALSPPGSDPPNTTRITEDESEDTDENEEDSLIQDCNEAMRSQPGLVVVGATAAAAGTTAAAVAAAAAIGQVLVDAEMEAFRNKQQVRADSTGRRRIAGSSTVSTSTHHDDHDDGSLRRYQRKLKGTREHDDYGSDHASSVEEDGDDDEKNTSHPKLRRRSPAPRADGRSIGSGSRGGGRGSSRSPRSLSSQQHQRRRTNNTAGGQDTRESHRQNMISPPPPRSSSPLHPIRNRTPDRSVASVGGGASRRTLSIKKRVMETHRARRQNHRREAAAAAAASAEGAGGGSVGSINRRRRHRSFTSPTPPPQPLQQPRGEAKNSPGGGKRKTKGSVQSPRKPQPPPKKEEPPNRENMIILAPDDDTVASNLTVPSVLLQLGGPVSVEEYSETSSYSRNRIVTGRSPRGGAGMSPSRFDRGGKLPSSMPSSPSKQQQYRQRAASGGFLSPPKSSIMDVSETPPAASASPLRNLSPITPSPPPFDRITVRKNHQQQFHRDIYDPGHGAKEDSNPVIEEGVEEDEDSDDDDDDYTMDKYSVQEENPWMNKEATADDLQAGVEVAFSRTPQRPKSGVLVSVTGGTDHTSLVGALDGTNSLAKNDGVDSAGPGAELRDDDPLPVLNVNIPVTPKDVVDSGFSRSPYGKSRNVVEGATDAIEAARRAASRSIPSPVEDDPRDFQTSPEPNPEGRLGEDPPTPVSASQHRIRAIMEGDNLSRRPSDDLDLEAERNQRYLPDPPADHIVARSSPVLLKARAPDPPADAVTATIDLTPKTTGRKKPQHQHSSPPLPPSSSSADVKKLLIPGIPQESPLEKPENALGMASEDIGEDRRIETTKAVSMMPEPVKATFQQDIPVTLATTGGAAEETDGTRTVITSADLRPSSGGAAEDTSSMRYSGNTTVADGFSALGSNGLGSNSLQGDSIVSPTPVTLDKERNVLSPAPDAKVEYEDAEYEYEDAEYEYEDTECEYDDAEYDYEDAEDQVLNDEGEDAEVMVSHSEEEPQKLEGKEVTQDTAGKAALREQDTAENVMLTPIRPETPEIDPVYTSDGDTSKIGQVGDGTIAMGGKHATADRPSYALSPTMRRLRRIQSRWAGKRPNKLFSRSHLIASVRSLSPSHRAPADAAVSQIDNKRDESESSLTTAGRSLPVSPLPNSHPSSPSNKIFVPEKVQLPALHDVTWNGNEERDRTTSEAQSVEEVRCDDEHLSNVADTDNPLHEDVSRRTGGEETMLHENDIDVNSHKEADDDVGVEDRNSDGHHEDENKYNGVDVDVDVNINSEDDNKFDKQEDADVNVNVDLEVGNVDVDTDDGTNDDDVDDDGHGDDLDNEDEKIDHEDHHRDIDAEGEVADYNNVELADINRDHGTASSLDDVIGGQQVDDASASGEFQGPAPLPRSVLEQHGLTVNTRLSPTPTSGPLSTIQCADGLHQAINHDWTEGLWSAQRVDACAGPSYLPYWRRFEKTGLSNGCGMLVPDDDAVQDIVIPESSSIEVTTTPQLESTDCSSEGDGKQRREGKTRSTPHRDDVNPSDEMKGAGNAQSSATDEVCGQKPSRALVQGRTIVHVVSPANVVESGVVSSNAAGEGVQGEILDAEGEFNAFSDRIEALRRKVAHRFGDYLNDRGLPDHNDVIQGQCASSPTTTSKLGVDLLPGCVSTAALDCAERGSPSELCAENPVKSNWTNEDTAAIEIQKTFRGRHVRHEMLEKMGVAKRRKWEERTKTQSQTKIHSKIRRAARENLRLRVSTYAHKYLCDGSMVLAVRGVCAVTIQRWWRFKMRTIRKKWSSGRKVGTSQRAVRAKPGSARVFLLQQRRSAIKLQSIFRRFYIQRCYRDVIDAVILIQSVGRMFIAKKNYVRERKLRLSYGRHKRRPATSDSVAGRKRMSASTPPADLELDESLAITLVEKQSEEFKSPLQLRAMRHQQLASKTLDMIKQSNGFSHGALIASPVPSTSNAAIVPAQESRIALRESDSKDDTNIPKTFFSSVAGRPDEDNRWVDPENFPRSWKRLRFETPKISTVPSDPVGAVWDTGGEEEASANSSIRKMSSGDTKDGASEDEVAFTDLQASPWDSLKDSSQAFHDEEVVAGVKVDEDAIMATSLLTKFKNGRFLRLRKKFTGSLTSAAEPSVERGETPTTPPREAMIEIMQGDTTKSPANVSEQNVEDLRPPYIPVPDDGDLISTGTKPNDMNHEAPPTHSSSAALDTEKRDVPPSPPKPTHTWESPRRLSTHLESGRRANYQSNSPSSVSDGTKSVSIDSSSYTASTSSIPTVNSSGRLKRARRRLRKNNVDLVPSGQPTVETPASPSGSGTSFPKIKILPHRSAVTGSTSSRGVFPEEIKMGNVAFADVNNLPPHSATFRSDVGEQHYENGDEGHRFIEAIHDTFGSTPVDSGNNTFESTFEKFEDQRTLPRRGLTKDFLSNSRRGSVTSFLAPSTPKKYTALASGQSSMPNSPSRLLGRKPGSTPFFLQQQTEDVMENFFT